jgi:BTB/POZ domain-containing protein KCTD9
MTGGPGSWRWERVRPALEDFTKLLTAASIIGAGLRYYVEADDRTMEQLYREWDTVRGSIVMGRDGARDHALEDLARRNESLENLYLDDAEMNGIDLRGALLDGSRMARAKLQRADLGCRGKRCSRLVKAELPGAILTEARLEGADMSRANMEGVVLLRACLRGATLRRAHLANAVLDSTNLGEADLREADLKDLSDGWHSIDLADANIYGVKNPPAGFVVWARDTMGAIDQPSDSAWRQQRDKPGRDPPPCPSPRG